MNSEEVRVANCRYASIGMSELTEQRLNIDGIRLSFTGYGDVFFSVQTSQSHRSQCCRFLERKIEELRGMRWNSVMRGTATLTTERGECVCWSCRGI